MKRSAQIVTLTALAYGSQPSTVSKNKIKMIGHHSRLRSYPI